MKSANQLVSIIMPTYNHAMFIGEAINSVLNQTYPKFELIIVDNFSDDNTEEIVVSYKDNRIKYLKFKNNGIIAASRNHGIKHSHGEYIAFLDSDDIWRQTKLERQIIHFKEENIIGIGADATIISNTPYYSQTCFGISKVGYIDYTYKDIFVLNPIQTSSVVVRKDILLSAGYFDQREDFRCIEDMELWLRMARFGKFRVLREKLLFYRAFTDVSRNRIDIEKNKFKIIKKHIELGYVKKSIAVERKAAINLSIARVLFDLGEPECKKYLIRAIKNSSVITRKIKAAFGYFLFLLPQGLRRLLLYLYYRNNSLNTLGRIKPGNLKKTLISEPDCR